MEYGSIGVLVNRDRDFQELSATLLSGLMDSIIIFYQTRNTKHKILDEFGFLRIRQF